ncbi:fumarylacetoacetate hydrolase family protein [Pelagibius sp. Alg239-R121]|uniref:fumarylacetoacetate hydrolase family protein n=1 Tax=Pelagibius sp. Alg239-R121 TaxID=2993448 RepID=UPI0024A60E39|nr:fumarylacetoacetate hydrolase family protein [Pelagibius sp. Alg239-R121]
MKLCSFRTGDRTSYGLVSGDAIVDLGARYKDAVTLRQFLASDGLEKAKTHLEEAPDCAMDAVTLAPVITDPDKIVCVGLNYHDHIKETGRTVTENPVLFSRYAGSQVGHGEPMIKPLESDKFDYEGELAVIMGKTGRRISEAEALSYVAGYACYNEGSVRDWQRHTHQFLPGKTFAGTGAFGPWMVTADEIPDPSALTLTTRLNGEVVQHSACDLMIASVPRLISYISTILPLLPGDVIVSGTPGGVGAKRNPPLWMRDGDSVEVEISSIGCLVNPVVAEG